MKCKFPKNIAKIHYLFPSSVCSHPSVSFSVQWKCNCSKRYRWFNGPPLMKGRFPPENFTVAENPLFSIVAILFSSQYPWYVNVSASSMNSELRTEISIGDWTWLLIIFGTNECYEKTLKKVQLNIDYTSNERLIDTQLNVVFGRVHLYRFFFIIIYSLIDGFHNSELWLDCHDNELDISNWPHNRYNMKRIANMWTNNIVRWFPFMNGFGFELNVGIKIILNTNGCLILCELFGKEFVGYHWLGLLRCWISKVWMSCRTIHFNQWRHLILMISVNITSVSGRTTPSLWRWLCINILSYITSVSVRTTPSL